MRSPVRSFAIMIAIIALLFGLYLLMGSIMEDTIIQNARTPEEKEAELAAEKEFFPKLDAFYDAKDFEGLVKLANSRESDKIDIWNYPHYDLLNYYSQYVLIRDEYLPMLDRREMSKGAARYLTEVTFAFYYRSYDHTMGSAGNASKSDLETLDGIRNDFFLSILYDRMGYTEDDMEAARGDIMQNNYFHTAEADKICDRYCERYK